MRINRNLAPKLAHYMAPECEWVYLHHEGNLMTGSESTSEGWDIDDGDFLLGAPLFQDPGFNLF